MAYPPSKVQIEISFGYQIPSIKRSKVHVRRHEGSFRAMLKAFFNPLQRKRLKLERLWQVDSIKESDFVDQSSLSQLIYAHLAYNKFEMNHLCEIELALQKNTKAFIGIA
jgi:hypothetical protein